MECFLAGDDMAFYKFAERVFELRNKYSYTDKMCSDYIVTADRADYSIEVTEDDIKNEASYAPASYPVYYLEFIAIHRKISELLVHEDCMLMHAAVIEYGGKAYAFSAKSGTGKTTHISLWEKVFGDDVRIINGDKPFVRRITCGRKTEFIAYGTPWCGKERKHINTCAPIAAFCILERSEENFAVRAGEEAVPFLLGEMLFKKDAQHLRALMGFADAFVSNVPIYRLGVNMEDSAAVMAKNAICKE